MDLAAGDSNQERKCALAAFVVSCSLSVLFWGSDSANLLDNKHDFGLKFNKQLSQTGALFIGFSATNAHPKYQIVLISFNGHARSLNYML